MGNGEGCTVKGSHQRAEGLGIKNALEGPDKNRNRSGTRRIVERTTEMSSWWLAHQWFRHSRELTLAWAAASIHEFV
jgi:hypothetical protein